MSSHQKNPYRTLALAIIAAAGGAAAAASDASQTNTLMPHHQKPVAVLPERRIRVPGPKVTNHLKRGEVRRSFASQRTRLTKAERVKPGKRP